MFGSIEEALKAHPERNIYLIGGKRIVEEGLATNLCSDVHLTRVGVDVPCDVHLSPDIFSSFKVNKTSQTLSEGNINFDYQHLINPETVSESYIDT